MSVHSVSTQSAERAMDRDAYHCQQNERRNQNVDYIEEPLQALLALRRQTRPEIVLAGSTNRTRVTLLEQTK